MTGEGPLEQLPPEEKRAAFVQATALLIVPSAIVILIIVGLIVGFTAWRVETVASDTNRLVREELREKDNIISQQQFILEEQATPAIIYMLNQMKAAGLDTPIVLLNPHCPPFNPAATVPPACPAPRPGTD